MLMEEEEKKEKRSRRGEELLWHNASYNGFHFCNDTSASLVTKTMIMVVEEE